MADTVRFPLDFETSAALRSVDRVAVYANKRFSNLKFGGPVDQNGGVWGRLDRQARAFNKTLEFANDRMVAFAATTTIVFGLGKAFQSLAENAIKAEKALAEIQVNVKLTSSEMVTLTNDLFVAANKTGQSFYAAAEAAAEFGRQGLKASEIAKATHAALVLTQISGMDAADSVKNLTAAINTFNKEGITYDQIVNKMAAADTNFAVSSKDLADAISRVGSTASDAGVKVDELLAIVTSLQQTTARGGAVIGNSLKTIFTRLQRDDVSAAIENIGIKTKDANGNFLNQIDVLKDLSKQYENLTDSQKSTISEKLGGVYQINIVKGIIQDLAKSTSTYGQALAIVGRAQNEAFIKSEFLGNTAVNKINEAKNSFVQFSEAIGKLGLNSGIGNLLDQFSSFAKTLSSGLTNVDTASLGEKIGQSAVKGVINAISGPGLGMLAVGLARLSTGVLSRFGKDLGGTLLGNAAGNLRAKSSAIIEQNRLQLESIQNERTFNNAVIQGNNSLQQRLVLMSRMNAGGSAMGVRLPSVPRSTTRTAASGIVPAMKKERADTKRGVGGAGTGARPIQKTLKLAPGHPAEPVVVNSHEVIIRNYQGSGADAVFNRDMIKQAGGKDALKTFGRVESVSGGSIPNFSGGIIQKGSSLLKTAGFLGRAAKEFGGSLPKGMFKKIISGKSNPEESFGLIQNFIKNPTSIIKSAGDLESAKNVLQTVLANDTVREKFARFIAPKVSTTFYDNKSAIPENPPYPDENYLKYKLFGGSQNLKEYQESSGFAHNSYEQGKNGKLQFRDAGARKTLANYALEARTRGEAEHSQAVARLTGNKNEYYANDATLGGYTGKYRKFKGEEYASYEDTWDVKLNKSEDNFLQKHLQDKTSPSWADVRGLKHLSNTYGAKSLDPFILRDLVSSIPNANPAVFKGLVKLPKPSEEDLDDLQIAGGFVPNFAGGFSKVKKAFKVGAAVAGIGAIGATGLGVNTFNKYFKNEKATTGLTNMVGATINSPERFDKIDKLSKFAAKVPGVRPALGAFMSRHGDLTGDYTESSMANIGKRGVSQKFTEKFINARISKGEDVGNAAYENLFIRKSFGLDVSKHPLVKEKLVSINGQDVLIKNSSDLGEKIKKEVARAEKNGSPLASNFLMGRYDFKNKNGKHYVSDLWDVGLSDQDKKVLTDSYSNKADNSELNKQGGYYGSVTKNTKDSLSQNAIRGKLILRNIYNNLANTPANVKMEGFASGFVPNFAGGKKNFRRVLGKGVDGSFEQLMGKNGHLASKNIGIKRFNYGFEDSYSAEKEYLMGKLLNTQNLMPGVTGPKIFGSFAGASRKATVGKEVISGFEPDYKIMEGLQNAMQSYLRQRSGVGASDLHGGNYFLNSEARDFLANPNIVKALKVRPQDRTGRLTGNVKENYLNRVETIFKGMESKGGKINIFDTGRFGAVATSSPFTDAAKKIRGYASGSVPNLAGGGIFSKIFGNKNQKTKPIGKFIGGGKDGEFRSLESTSGLPRRQKIGIKTFNPRTAISTIVQERAYGKLLNEVPMIPGVGGPKILSGLSQTIAKKRIGKEIVGGIHPNKNTTYTEVVRDSLTRMFKDKGVPAGDLHERNVLINDKANEFLSRPKIQEQLRKRFDRIQYGNDYDEKRKGFKSLDRFYGRMEKFGGRIDVVDTGRFSPIEKSSQYYSKYKEMSSLAGGSIPRVPVPASKVHSLLGGTKFQNIKYYSQPKKGDPFGKETIKEIKSAQHSSNVAHQDKVGMAPPSGYGSWEDYQTQNSMTTIRGIQGDKKVIKNIKWNNVKEIHADGKIYDVIRGAAKGLIPNFAKGTPRNINKMTQEELERLIKNKNYNSKARKAAQAVLFRRGRKKLYDLKDRLTSEKTAKRENLDKLRSEMPNVFKDVKDRDKRMAYPHIAMIGPKELTQEQREAAKRYDTLRSQFLGSPIQPSFTLPRGINSISPSPPISPMVTPRLARANTSYRLKSAQVGIPRIKAPYFSAYQDEKNSLSGRARRKNLAEMYRGNKSLAKEEFRKKRGDRRQISAPVYDPIRLENQKRTGISATGIRGGPQYDPLDVGRDKRQGASLALSEFRSRLSENPYMSKKDIDALARETSITNKGVIPEKELKSAQKQARQARNQRHSGKVGAISGAAVFGGSVVGDAVGMPKLGAAASTIGLFSSMGSAAGPVGTALGVAVGAIVGFSGAMKDSTMPLEKLQKDIGELASTTEKYQGAIQSYFTSTQDLDRIMKDPTASAEQVKNASRKKAISLAEMPSEIRDELLSKTTEEEKVSFSNKFLNQQQEKVNASTALGSITQNATDNNNPVALAWRKLTKGREGSVELDSQKLGESINSFIANFDIETLREKASDTTTVKGVEAAEALKAYNENDLPKLLEKLKGLDIIPDSVLLNSYGAVSGADQGVVKGITTQATAKKQKAQDIAEEEAKQFQLKKTSFEDFSKYQKSFEKKTALDQTLSSSTGTLMNARLGIVANQESTPQNIKETIAYAQEISSLNEKDSILKSDTAQKMMAVLGDTYAGSGRNALNEAGGSDFIGRFLKAQGDPKNVEASLDELIKMTAKTDENGKVIANFSQEQIKELSDLKNEFTKQTTENQVQRQIALEQLKALQDISRKQKFDKLIESLRSGDAMAMAFENVDFSDLKDQVLNPDKKTVRKDLLERTVAVRNRNSSVLIGKVQERADEASRLLDADKIKKARGEAGLSIKEQSDATLIMARGKTAEQITYETNAAKNTVEKNNLPGGLNVKNALDKSNFIIAGEGDETKAGSFESIDKAISVLKAAISDIDNPESKNSIALTNLVDSMTQTKNARIGATGVYDDSKMIIKDLMARTTEAMKSAQSVNPNVDVSSGAKRLEGLSEALRKLEAGDGKAALTNIDPVLSTLRKMIGEVNSKVQDKSFEEAVKEQSRGEAGVTDFKSAFDTSFGIVKTSNDALTTALGSLQTQVTNLSTIMATEAQVASKSKNISDLTNAIDPINQQKRLVESQIGANVVSDQEYKKALETSKDRKYDALLQNLNKNNANMGPTASYLLERKNTGKVPEKDSTQLDYFRNKLIEFFPKGSEERKQVQSFDDNYFRVLKDKTFGSSATPEQTAQLAGLQSAIDALNKTIQTQYDQIQQIREQAKEKESAAPSSTESKTTSTVDINVAGLGQELLDIFKDGIMKVVQDNLNFSSKYPNAAAAGLNDAMMG